MEILNLLELPLWKEASFLHNLKQRDPEKKFNYSTYTIYVLYLHTYSFILKIIIKICQKSIYAIEFLI